MANLIDGASARNADPDLFGFVRNSHIQSPPRVRRIKTIRAGWVVVRLPDGQRRSIAVFARRPVFQLGGSR